VIGRWVVHRKVIRQDLWPALAVVVLTVIVAPRVVLATLGPGGVAPEARGQSATVTTTTATAGHRSLPIRLPSAP